MEVVDRVPVAAGSWDQVIEWNIDDTRAGFKKTDKFRSGPALLKGDPTKGCHVAGGIPFYEGVVAGHIACSSLLNFF